MGQSATVAERVADALMHRIVTGELPPGTRLRQEQFAAEFGVSHVPVREAFLRLEVQKLVVSEPRRGARVAPLDSAREREIIELRAALEVLALRAIQGRVSSKHLEAMKAALYAGDAAIEIVGWEAANRAFHIELAKPCGMPRLISLIAELNLAYSRYVIAVERPLEWKPAGGRHHWQIYEALEAGETDRAVRLLEAHIRTIDRVPSRPAGLRRRG